MSERDPWLTEKEAAKERLLEAIATCIVARQGNTNRDRAKHVLAEIEAQGWSLVPPDGAQ